MYFKKNVILLPSNFDGKEGGRVLLCIENHDDRVSCVYKPYSMPNLNGKILLGITFDNALHKFEIDDLTKTCQFEINNQPFSQNTKISAVIVNVLGNNYNSLVWGTTQLSSAYSCMIEDLQAQNIKNIEKFNVTNLEKQHINNNYLSGQNLETSTFDEANLNQASFEKEQENCEEEFILLNSENEQDELFDQQEIEEVENDEYFSEKEIDDIIKATSKDDYFTPTNFKNTTNSQNFYELISEQVEKMLADNQTEEILQEIIPDSVFVKIGDDTQSHNVFGVIYQNDKVKYICYGVYANYGNSPQTPASFYQWLPIDADNPYGEGYYMSYQDADTGENLQMQVI